jgi:all-trans-retinol dehydrogenase (NAD+)
MIDSNHGHIVTIASAAAFFGVNKLVDYAASKSFLIGFIDGLKNEIEHMNPTNKIKFTTVCPTWINTGMCDGVTS